jgi:hypothetical protein
VAVFNPTPGLIHVLAGWWAPVRDPVVDREAAPSDILGFGLRGRVSGGIMSAVALVITHNLPYVAVGRMP